MKRTLILLLTVLLMLFAGCSTTTKDKMTEQAEAKDETVKEAAAEETVNEEAANEEVSNEETGDGKVAEETAADSINEYETVGIEMDLSELIENSKGLVTPNPLGVFDIVYHHIYAMPIYYAGMPKEEAYRILYNSESSAEELKKVYDLQLPINIIVASDIDYDATVKSLSEILRIDYTEEMTRAEVIGNADGFTFYSIPERNDEKVSRLDAEYAEEFEKLRQDLLEIERSARFFAPVDPAKELIGQKLEFTTTDLDGNTVTSKELFSVNEITMVNCWGLWCGNCMNEMAELKEIHERIQKKGCGIVGLEYEGTMTDELVQQSKDFFSELGITYPNVQLPEEMAEQLTAFPTTFYVDKEGTILSIPIVGADVKAYEPVLDSLLNGSEVTADTDAVESDPTNAATETQDILYNVYVTDENGPVEGATIQFCSDSCCKMGKTDASGLTSFSMPAGDVYDVHVLRVPEGYEKDDTVYHTTDGSSDVQIQLKKK